MTVNEIVARVQTIVGSDITSARIIEVLNEVYPEICSIETDWNFMEKESSITLTASEDDVTLPSDFGQVLTATILAENRPLLPERRSTILKMAGSDLTSTGLPQYYMFVKDAMKLYPVPASAYVLTLLYRAEPDTLAAGGAASTILIPARHHAILVYATAAQILREEDDESHARQFDTRYERRLAAMREDCLFTQFDMPESAYPMDGYESYEVF